MTIVNPVTAPEAVPSNLASTMWRVHIPAFKNPTRLAAVFR